MQQWQSQVSYGIPPRQQSRGHQSPGWTIFWATWWMLAALPWLFVFWWRAFLPIAFVVLVDVFVLFIYVVGFSKASRKSQKATEQSVKPSHLPTFYEQGYQEQRGGISEDRPPYPWDEQPQASYPELETDS